MRHQTDATAGWETAKKTMGLPAPLDCESRALLRLFLAPILENASTWAALDDALRAKGYDLVFREGHLVILNDLGVPLCTGRDIGVPMAEIAARIGRPNVMSDRQGRSGALRRQG